MRVERIGDAVLYLGRCEDIMPRLGSFEAVITDPPYGIEYQSRLGNLGATAYAKIANDTSAINLRPILEMPCPVFAFGANCFPEQLPHRGMWLCWDKRTIDGACDAMLGSPIELGWANKTSGYNKIVRVLHGGAVNADGGKREHPTQKPIQVMIEAIRWAAPKAETILDPYCGSATTGIAAIRLGRKFVGIECEEKYFDVAIRRITEAYRQADLFIPNPSGPPAKTGDMFK